MPGSTVPAVYVQLVAVRIVPARVRVPDGLLMTTSGRSPAAVVAAPVKVWAPAPLIRRVAVPPVIVEAWLIVALGGERAGAVEGAGREADRSRRGQGRPGGDRGRRPEVDER